MLIFGLEDMIADIAKMTNITNWMKRVDIIPEVASKERYFQKCALELLEGRLTEGH